MGSVVTVMKIAAVPSAGSLDDLDYAAERREITILAPNWSARGKASPRRSLERSLESLGISDSSL